MGEDLPESQGKFKRAYIFSKRNKEWNKIYSITPIEVEILMDGLTLEEAFEKEIEFIHLYGRIQLKNGPLCNRMDCSPLLTGESKKRHLNSVRKNKEKIIQKDFDGNIVKIWDCKAEAAFELTGKKSTSSIRKCLDGYFFHAHNFRWEYFDEEKQKKIVRTYENPQKIVQMNLNGEVVKIWGWLAQVLQYGFVSTAISNCCKKRNKHSISCGYKWEYFDENKKYIFSENPVWWELKKDKRRKIAQIKDGKVIKIWDSIKDAALGNSIKSDAGIGLCCRNKVKSASGFQWKYAENV